MRLMNASGCCCTTLEELEYLDSGKCPVDVVITKSCTLWSRKGNTESSNGRKKIWYAKIPHGSINSNGLCNLGADEYIKYGLRRTSKTKQYYISIAGISLEEKIAILRRIERNAGCCDLVEFNFSCPNIDQDEIPSWVVIDGGLQKIEREFPDVKYGVKLPPLLNRYEWKRMADVLNAKNNIVYVSCCNSIPNGYFPSEKSNCGVIEPRGGFGGIGGSYLKPISLANIKAYHKLLEPRITIFGCGGVKSTVDILDYQRCGAAGVQVGTWLLEKDCRNLTVGDKFRLLRGL